MAVRSRPRETCHNKVKLLIPRESESWNSLRHPPIRCHIGTYDSSPVDMPHQHKTPPPPRPARPEETAPSPLTIPLVIPRPLRTQQELFQAEDEWRGKLIGKMLCEGVALDDGVRGVL